MQIVKPPHKCTNYSFYLSALKGKRGLEIGGPSPLFQKRGTIPLYDHIHLDGCNFSGSTIWEGSLIDGDTYRYSTHIPPGHQYILDAVNLSPIPSKKYDFVLSCHSLEHVANPLKALNEWIRVTKPRGYILLILPEKSNTFDHNRQVTTLDHLITDYKNNIKEDDLSHLDEILALHDVSRDGGTRSLLDLKARALKNYENRAIHHHVFDLNLLYEIFQYLDIELICSEFVLPYHNIVLGRL
ncbi:MAG: methyltransferase domain-containing protein [Methanosarcina sp.]|nr:methyltransferase domain-containing protein [Methanosarcina sp.]